MTACKHCSGVSCNNPTKVVTDLLMEDASLNDACHEVTEIDDCDQLLASVESHKLAEDLLEFLLPRASEVEVGFQ